MICVHLGTRIYAALLAESAEQFYQRVDYKAIIPPPLNGRRSLMIVTYDNIKAKAITMYMEANLLNFWDTCNFPYLHKTPGTYGNASSFFLHHYR